jgi:hypothetical protein
MASPMIGNLSRWPHVLNRTLTCTLADDKIVEEWTNCDTLGML